MRIVVDTNVLISALLKANSTPAKIVALWRAGDDDHLLSLGVYQGVTILNPAQFLDTFHRL